MDKESLYQVIDTLTGLKYTGGVTDIQIADVESELGITFAQDFIFYLQKYGQMEASGIELMGISNRTTTSVANATRSFRKICSLRKDLYVIEDLGIDGIEYLQDKSGKVYQFITGSAPRLYSSSLIEYIKQSTKQ